MRQDRKMVGQCSVTEGGGNGSTRRGRIGRWLDSVTEGGGNGSTGRGRIGRWLDNVTEGGGNGSTR